MSRIDFTIRKSLPIDHGTKETSLGEMVDDIVATAAEDNDSLAEICLHIDESDWPAAAIAARRKAERKRSRAA